MLLFYDAEVFLADWLFVIVNPITKERHVFVNDAASLASFHEQHQDHIWVGYNSRHYDQYILKGILCGFDPHSISNHIIAEKKQGWQYSSLLMKIPLNQFDVMTTMHGLKELEGFMGHDIRETTVSFDTNRKLTDQEIDEVIRYCTHDVEETMEIFLHRKEEFDSQMALLKAFQLPLKYVGKTKAQLAAVILKARQLNREDEFDLRLPDTLKIQRYAHIVDWYQNPVNHNYEKSLETTVSGVPHAFAWGGLHGALDQYQDEGILVSVDVALNKAQVKSFEPDQGCHTMWLTGNPSNANGQSRGKQMPPVVRGVSEPVETIPKGSRVAIDTLPEAEDFDAFDNKDDKDNKDDIVHSYKMVNCRVTMLSTPHSCWNTGFYHETSRIRTCTNRFILNECG